MKLKIDLKETLNDCKIVHHKKILPVKNSSGEEIGEAKILPDNLAIIEIKQEPKEAFHIIENLDSITMEAKIVQKEGNLINEIELYGFNINLKKSEKE